jgi:hypothetical protein
VRLGRREGGEGRKAGERERERERVGGGGKAERRQGRAGQGSRAAAAGRGWRMDWGRKEGKRGGGTQSQQWERPARKWLPHLSLSPPSPWGGPPPLPPSLASFGSIPFSLSQNSNPSHLKTKDRMSRSSSLNELTPSPECFVTNSFLVVFTTEISSIRQNVSKENQALHRHHHPLEARRNSMQFSFFFCVSEPRVRDEYTSCSSENI